MGASLLAGSLYGRFFQWGYVTRDLDAAMAQFNASFGIQDYSVFVNSNPLSDHPSAKAVTRVCFSWIGTTQLEILEIDGSLPSIYREFLPPSKPDIKLHHFGFLVDDLDATIARLRNDGYDIPFVLIDPSNVAVAYADTRSRVGHYLEYISLTETGRRWFASMPGFCQLPT
jgi:hypothetical protein